MKHVHGTCSYLDSDACIYRVGIPKRVQLFPAGRGARPYVMNRTSTFMAVGAQTAEGPWRRESKIICLTGERGAREGLCPQPFGCRVLAQVSRRSRPRKEQPILRGCCVLLQYANWHDGDRQTVLPSHVE
eukprot:6204347-Pleurochrysis_carterae.AAC.3